jgi:zinc protease
MALLEPEVTKLSNGLTVVVLPNTSGQTVTVHVYVKDGSRGDPAEKPGLLAGLLHMLEHDNFKGTKKLPGWRDVHEFLSWYSRNGDAVGADTSFEHVRFYMQGMPDQLESMIFFLSELTLRPRIIERAMNHEFQKEKSVILEEYWQYEDDPALKAEEHVWQMIYRGYQLGLPVVGTPETIAAIKRNDLVRRFHAAFRPENMLVIVQGKVGERTPLKYVKLHFMRRRRSYKSVEGLVPWMPPSVRTQPLEKRIYFERRPLHKFYFAIGFPTRGLREPNRYAVKVLSRILGERWGSLMMTELREKHGIGYHPESEVQELSDSGMVLVKGDLVPEHLLKGLGKIQSLMRRLATKPIDEKMLEAAKMSMVADYYQNVETPDWVAEHVYNTWKMGENIKPLEGEIRSVKAVTADEVRRVARRIFTSSRLHISVIGPFSDAIAEEQVMRLVKGWEFAAKKPAVKKLPVAGEKPAATEKSADEKSAEEIPSARAVAESPVTES